MSGDSSVAGLIDAAGQAIRVANHRTLDSIGAHSVPDVYRILGELSTLAHHLPQLCDQLTTNLQRRQDLDGLRLDHDGQHRYQNPAEAITETCQALTTAATAASEFTRAIDGAQSACAVLADTGSQADNDDQADNDERGAWL